MQGRPTSEENWETAAVIDERVRQLARQGVSDPVLVNRVLGYMPALHRLYASATDAELAALAAVYPGFVRYARLMEDMSEAMRTGVGVLPGVTGFPLAQEPLKGLLEGMLASGATLEQQLQNRKDEPLADNDDPLLEPLYRRWTSALPEFLALVERYTPHPRAQSMIVQVLKEMADRIENLHAGAGLA